jgi:LmbE family N-acetylglucosaminyl deacetylase
LPRLANLVVIFLSLSLTLAAGAPSLRAQGLAPLPKSGMPAGSSVVGAGSSAPLQLAFLNETGPWRRHTELPLSDSDATLRVPTQIRLLLFSPHPDDETLGAGGLVQRVLKRGGSVRVVWMTNGDGFLDGVRSEFEIAEPTSHDFIEYGKLRQKEALKAIAQWGLEEGDAVFMGFPDSGLDRLWASHWSASHPYTSPTTRWDRSAYPDSYARAVRYSGSDLVEAIIRVMRDFSPDWVALPDPRDMHSDHAATGAFVLDALRKLRESGEPHFSDTQAFTYLVHYPNYPNSEGWMTSINRPGAGSFLTAGRSLTETQWLSLPIDSDELEGKRRALACHDTQMESLQWFFNIFLMRYETFGRLRPSQIMEIPVEYAARFRRPNS